MTHDLIMDFKRKRWLGHVIRMDKTKVATKRKISVFWDTRPRRLIGIKVSKEPASAIFRVIQE
jgi:hypothetical protein